MALSTSSMTVLIRLSDILKGYGRGSCWARFFAYGYSELLVYPNLKHRMIYKHSCINKDIIRVEYIAEFAGWQRNRNELMRQLTFAVFHI